MTHALWDLVPHMTVYEYDGSRVVHADPEQCITVRGLSSGQSPPLNQATLQDVLKRKERPVPCYERCQQGLPPSLLEALYNTLHVLQDLQEVLTGRGARDVACGILNGRSQLKNGADKIELHRNNHKTPALQKAGADLWELLEDEVGRALKTLRHPDLQARLLEEALPDEQGKDDEDLWILVRPLGRHWSVDYADVLFDALCVSGHSNEVVVANKVVIDHIKKQGEASKELLQGKAWSRRWQVAQAPPGIDTILGLYEPGGAGPLADLHNAIEAAKSVLT